VAPVAVGTSVYLRVNRPLTVRKAPSARAAVVTRLAATTEMGSKRVLAVAPASTETEGWVHVALPERPNGSTGWVPAAQVRLVPVHDSILIDLSSRKLWLRLKGQEEVETAIAVGSTKNPTPVGTFYVTDRVKPPNPNGDYGPFALGLSAHSETLTSYGTGDGQVGIHGTNEPASIGRDVTHGCIRVPNDVSKLLAKVHLGSPVEIRE